MIACSQADTDSVVVIPKAIAISIAKDLERLDQADSTIILLELELDNYARQLGLQDRVISGHKLQIVNLNNIIIKKEAVIGVNDKEVAYWEKQYKKQKRQKFLVGGVALLLVVLAFVGGGS